MDCEDINERVKMSVKIPKHEMGILGKRWSVFGSEKSRIKQGKKESKSTVSGEVKSQLNPTGSSEM